MSTPSPRLSLPFLQPAQAQKHVTHNEALRDLDALVQLTVESFGATTPPGAPVEGTVFALGTGATGDWSGHGGALAYRFDSAWEFYTPRAGWIAVAADTSDARVHTGSDWVPLATILDLDNLASMGINAAADPVNRLSVSAPATLLNHDGGDHQLKINKAGAGNTASLLFQSDWSGRAEMGLAGDDGFSVKISADGTTWTEAMRVDPGESVITTASIVGAVGSGGGAGTAIIETGGGLGGHYTKFADGTMICFHHALSTTSGAVTDWAFPVPFSSGAYAVSLAVEGSTPAVATVSSRTSTSVGIESFDLSGSDAVAPTVCVTIVGRWN